MEPKTKEERRVQTETALLTGVTADLRKDMSRFPAVKSVQAMAYQIWDEATKQELQVHVIVTRDPEDFLEPFQTIETE